MWLATSQKWTDWLPITVFIIHHPSGVVLFDSGQDIRAITETGQYYPRGPLGWLVRRAAMLDVRRHETLPALMRQHEIEPGTVRHIVLSHFHPDHIGGLRDLPKIAPEAAVVASRAELSSLGARVPELGGILPQHIDLPHVRWQETDHRPLGGDGLPADLIGLDLMDDGSLVILPTPGHTPGSQSLLVRAEGAPPLLLVGDAGFREDLMLQGHLPGVGAKRPMRDSTATLVRLARQLGAVLLPAHDPGTAARLTAALSTASPT